MLDPTNSEIILRHIKTNPEAFLQALNDAPGEVQKAVIAHIKTTSSSKNLPSCNQGKP